LKITLLGTATSQGIPVIGCDCSACMSSDIRDKRLRCSALIQTDNANIVIDVGPDFRQQMITAQVKDMDAVLLTHEHNDHVIGLDDLRPFIFSRRTPMTIYAEQRVLDEIIVRFKYAFEDQAYPGAPRFELKAINPGDLIQIGDIDIEVLRIHHGNLPILGFKINRFAYLTDTNHIPENTLLELRDMDIVVIDALRKQGHHSHFSLDESLRAIKDLNPAKAYLIHMSHVLGPTSEWEKELPPNVFASFDGLQFEF
jgi:phosphoribosyl 1,2-cyclic phosphate phosphodiesterase